MTFCSNNNVSPSMQIEYASGSSPGRMPTHLRAPEVQSGYALYPDLGEGNIRNGWYIICPKETRNLVKNPTFFNDLSDWTTFNAQLSRTNVNSFDSGFSGLIRGSGDIVTADRRAYIETEIEAFTPGYNYVFSGYLWIPQIWDSQDPLIGTISIVDDDGVTVEEVFSEKLDKFQKWQRIAITKAIRPDATSVFVRINLRSQDQQELLPPYPPTGFFNLISEYLYVDMLQFELGVTPTTPFHGDYRTCATPVLDTCEPYRWLGIPHRSISERTECTRDGGELVSLSSLGFEILEHTGHGAPPVRDIFFDYANRPGGEYQKTVVDTNVLTLSGYICERTLKELECAIFDLQDKIFPDISVCGRGGLMLLVYVHETCENRDCDPERYLAYCVSYIQGFEGVRNNLYQQRIALQFRAHQPFPFEWPGHTAHPLDFNSVITEKSLVKIGLDEVRGYPLENRDYRTFSCTNEKDKFIIGGMFDDGVNDIDESQNIAVFDCNEICEYEFLGGTAGGAVNVSIRDAEGKIIVGGDFTMPYRNIAVYHPELDAFSGVGAYSGGEVLSLAAPFWADIVAGTANSVHIIITEGSGSSATSTELIFGTDGVVEAFAVDPEGALYAFGAFTMIDGVAAAGIARFDVNTSGCLDINNASWESLGFSLDGDVRAADVQGDTIYIGGNFTTATPDLVEQCDTVEGNKMESKGGNQEVRFSNVGGNIFRLDFQLLNPLSQSFANEAFFTTPNTERMVRFTAKSTLGTTYVFLIPEDAIVGFDFATINLGPPALYTVSIDVDITYVLTGVCATLNPDLVDQIRIDLALIQTYSGIQYPNGIGIDDSINSVTLQAVQRVEGFQGDPVAVNNVGCINGDNITALGDGIPVAVNEVFVHPDTGEILVGTEPGSGFTDGLGVWTGREWISYPADLGGIGADNRIIKIDYCNCDLYILFEGGGTSLVPGLTDVQYNGGVEKFDFDLMIHGPGRLHSFSLNQKSVRFCTELQCGEVGRLSFDTGDFVSNSRSLSPSILGGSRYDLALGRCSNLIKFLMTDTDAQTKATIIYSRCYAGVEALCCAEANRVVTVQPVDVCCPRFEIDVRDPTDDDCAQEGFREGDLWLNSESQCPVLFVNVGGECCDEDQGAYNYIGGGGEILLQGDIDAEPDEENALCPPEDDE